MGGSTDPNPGEHLDAYGDPDLLAALRKLPDAQRAAVILFYYADLPVHDIAARLGSNSLAVRANLSRAEAVCVPMVVINSPGRLLSSSG